MGKRLILIRGLPGSGKSYLAKRLLEQIDGLKRHLEADDFFTSEHGSYRYDPKRIGEAHAECQTRAIEAMHQGQSYVEATVIISNTFTRAWEMSVYRAAAAALGFTMVVIRATGEWGSTHGVPDEVIHEMRYHFEDVDDEIRDVNLDFELLA